jgi:hypothetical protein
MLLLERLQAAEEVVVLGVGDRRIVEDVVAVVVLLDFPPQPLDLAPDVRLHAGHRRVALAA